MVGIRDELRRVLACPDCGGSLDDGESELVCCSCRRSFPVANSKLPVLIAKNSEFACHESEFANWREKTEPVERLRSYRQRYHFPVTTPYSTTQAQIQQVVAEVEQTGLVLNLGSGRKQRPNDRWVHLDILPQHNCDVVADAHHLPFRNESFSAVVSQSVFELLDDPRRVADELRRVLLPGGMVCVNVAFLLPVTHDADRFRFTKGGLCAIFQTWEIVRAGPSAGPFMAMARLAERIAETLLPGRLFSAGGAWLAAWTLHPLKYLDPWILRRKQGERAASGFFVVAKKPCPRAEGVSPPGGVGS